MSEPEYTPEQVSACERAMDGLEAQADIWAERIGLVTIVKTIGDASRGLSDRMPKDVRNNFINRQEANIDALARQAYFEGYMNGGDSRKQYDDLQYAEIREDNEQLNATFDLTWEADMRAVKLWREAHPGNDLTMPDRGDMVVWLLEKYAPTLSQEQGDR